uniref:Uncharacterized protein n=1 Tax=Photinus pyralis TaxID=7054 RepID=A0A1Y1MHQ7_PHOPY
MIRFGSSGGAPARHARFEIFLRPSEMNSEMGECQEVVFAPSGKVLIEHTPSGTPFAPWGQGDDDDVSDKQAREGDTAKFVARCSSDILCLVSPMLETLLNRR